MKFITTILSLITLSTINHELSTAFAQGSLTPPGAPAPTMKSLDQIEARTPIATAPFTISQSGSYYLTGNLTVTDGNAITIATSGVTLDLGGWTITSTAASATGSGVQLNGGLSDVTIFNGHVVSGVTNNGSGVYGGSGFAAGVSFSGAAPLNTRVSGVSVSGCLLYGINLGYGDATIAEACAVHTVGSYGVDASTIKSSVATDCGLYGIIGDQISNSRGEITGNGSGLLATSAENSFGSSTLGGTTGLYCQNANNCSGVCSSNGYGVLATGCANNCSGSSVNGGDGVYAGANAHNCYGTSTGNGYGVYAGTVSDSYGSTANGVGVYASYLAQNCYGLASGTGAGLYVAILITPGRGSLGAAQNCVGTSVNGGTGLQANVANNCTGTSFNVVNKYNMP